MKLELHEDYAQPWTEKDICGNFPEKYMKFITLIADKASLIEGDFGFSLLQTREMDETSVCKFDLELTVETRFRLLLEEDRNALFYCIKNEFRILLPNAPLIEIPGNMYTIIQFPAGSHEFTCKAGEYDWQVITFKEGKMEDMLGNDPTSIIIQALSQNKK